MQAAIEGIVWQGFDPAASFHCPLTILAADPAFGAVFLPEDVAPVLATNPSARIVQVPGAGHSIRVGATFDAYTAELERFLVETC
jgi:pimeloyl-ACP methyl ester carboxylesterase